MKKVLVFGTFDIFHKGHRDFLRQAREHGLPASSSALADGGRGDFLRVVVARDETVARVKSQNAINGEDERVDVIKKSGLADEVVLGTPGDKFDVVRDFSPDVICLGYDQEQSEKKLRKILDEAGLEKTQIIRLKSFHPEKYKSSLLRKLIEHGT